MGGERPIHTTNSFRKNVKQLRRREPDDTKRNPLMPFRDRQIGSYTEDEAVHYSPLVGDGPSTSAEINYKIRPPAGQSRLEIPTQSRSSTPSEVPRTTTTTRERIQKRTKYRTHPDLQGHGRTSRFSRSYGSDVQFGAED